MKTYIQLPAFAFAVSISCAPVHASEAGDWYALPYQAMAGASYGISPRAALTAQYRWMSAGKVHCRDLSGFEHIREHKGHNVDFGIRVGF